jgi:hypothetical protein
MADQPPSNESDEQATIAWLESEGIVTTSAQRVYFEQTAAGLAPDQALIAAIGFAQAEEDAMGS